MYIDLFVISSSMADVPTFKKFVSEDELEEQKRKRQEEWEKVRRPDQPLGRYIYRYILCVFIGISPLVLHCFK